MNSSVVLLARSSHEDRLWKDLDSKNRLINLSVRRTKKMNIYSFTCAIREQNYLWIFRWIIYGSDGAYILFKYAVWDDYKDNLVEFTMAYRPVDIHPASTLTCHGLIVPVWKK